MSKIESPSESQVHTFNKYSQNKYCTIVLTDSSKTEGLNIAIMSDSLFGVAENSLKRVSLSQVDHVTFKSVNAGHVIAGIVGGLLAAQVITLFLVKRDNCSDCQEETNWEAVNDRAMISGAVILGGGILGLTIRGNRIYYFNSASYKAK